MKKLQETLHWLDMHRDSAYSLIRIILGSALFIRGWIFFSDPAAITELARADSMHMWFSYVTIAHLVVGFLMIFGLPTRIAALFQIPISVSAIYTADVKQRDVRGIYNSINFKISNITFNYLDFHW